MDNLRWLKILDEKKKLDPERIVAPIDENLPAYTVEGINTETSESNKKVWQISSIDRY